MVRHTRAPAATQRSAVERAIEKMLTRCEREAGRFVVTEGVGSPTERTWSARAIIGGYVNEVEISTHSGEVTSATVGGKDIDERVEAADLINRAAAFVTTVSQREHGVDQAAPRTGRLSLAVLED